jgi:nitrogen fixation protein NifU and related proteins
MSTPYTAALLEHFRRPRNFGALNSPTAVYEVLNPLCGDRIRMEVNFKGGVVADVRFRGDACAICIASASLLTERIRGMARGEARRIGESEVLAALQAPVPDTRLRCALLPLEALRGCLDPGPVDSGALGSSDPG